MAKGLVGMGVLDAPANFGGDNAPISVAYAEPSSAGTVDSGTVKNVASTDANDTLHFAVALIAIALVLLWAFGGIVFKNVVL